ncbi:expressed unknown protein [Seminavis robusta]|uniref:Uncharacterized protein n=1 Tax=Seminavis robusta TaxID=568900 RepID=A0A9N8HMI3_9STRA|nr:expressed unknown protein [Seminavis robusta]|eukprot:Sro901_g217990.1 n/a (232) ;mRNA; r:18048-18743
MNATTSKNDFRARYYSKLGIFPQPPLSSCTSSSSKSPVRLLHRQSSSVLSTRSSPPCLRHKRSVLHTTPAKDQRVSFHPEVKLYRIKHHEDYSDEEWDNMWVDADTLDYEKDRNSFEFHADGSDWRNATEEEHFQDGGDGSLIHPATWVAYRHQWEKHGSLNEPVDFKALLRPARRWSPRPVKQRKTFWLFDLAMESVQKGKNAVESRHRTDHHHHRHHPQPTRQTDRGWP